MAESTHLALPYLSASQAQKHVTHNEAIRLLDGIVQMSVKDRDRTTPPGAPADGDRHLVGSGATGAWHSWDLSIAYYVDGAWMRLAARPGWLCWIEADEQLLAYDGADWGPIGAGGDGRLLKGITRLYSSSSMQLGADVTAILVKAVGAGGGGGGAEGGTGGGAVGGGGAGGAYVEALKEGVGGDTLTYSIGSGGAGGADAGDNGGDGGTTSISNGDWTLEAEGGVGGNGQGNGNWGQAVAGGYGRNATGGDLNVGGQAGTGGIRLDEHNNLAGPGASSAFGSGGQAFAGTAGGQQGLGHGAGGGGGAVASAADGQPGGAGSDGYIEIWGFTGGPV